MTEPESLLRQTAGEQRAAARPGLGEDIEIDLGHAWSSRYCTKSGTGRPVAPFSPPPFQAVPAMSRCAQVMFLVKRARKEAAVMAPPSRPATSAKLLFRPSWYSS